MTELDGKGCLVTGGASGIGTAIVRKLAARGAAVAICDLNIDGAEAIAAELRAAGGKAIAVQADVTNAQQVNGAVDRTVEAFGSLHALYNNAGMPAIGDLDEITADYFDKVMRVNGYSVVLGTQAAARVMKPQGHGKIINTCSVAGKVAFPGHTLYAASKFATRAFTIGFARELAPHGIQVNAICPGMVRTPLWSDISEKMQAKGADIDGARLVESFAEPVALKRSASPDEIAGVAVFLATSEADYMIGQCINIDGGLIFD